MLRSYVAITLKVLRKHVLYSFIKVFGLAVGLAACFLIAAFVRFELSYDSFHENADQIVRIVKEDAGNFYLGSNRFAVTPAPLPDALEEEIPDVVVATQINDSRVLLSVGANTFMEDGISATGTFFDVFSFDLLEGNVTAALTDPNSILLTPALAERLFGEDEAIGQVVEYTYYDTSLSLAVTGIIEAPPSNSHFDFSFVVPMATDDGHVRGIEENRWGSNSWYTYAVLVPGADRADFAERIAELGHRHLQGEEWYRDNPERRTTYYAQALTDIHLRSHINFEISPTGDSRYVYLFALIGLAILFTASVNYMNLATARASTRAKEIGIRKASGAERSNLIGQFMGESVVVTLFALGVAGVLVAASWSFFEQLIQRDMPADLLLDRWGMGVGLLVGVGVGLLSGSYPALVMSGYRPVDVLKGRPPARTGRLSLRNGLVVAQFSVGVMLIFATIVVGRQIQFMGTAETGIQREQVLSLRVRDQALPDQWQALKSELQATPGVVAVSSSSSLPTRVSSQSGVEDWTGREEGQSLSIYTASVNHGYEALLGLELVEGRGFSPEHADEGSGVLINETARRALGWESAVGKTVSIGSSGTEVVGVLKDYHFHSFRQEIAPLALRLQENRITRILLKIEPSTTTQTVGAIGDVMTRFSPDYPFDYEFLDDAYNQMYQSDRQLGTIFSVFTAIALFIACLGLFGMAAFMAQLRTKEIGVRKVLGAGMGSIVALMSRDLGRLVVLAVLIGGPVAYFAMQRWLGGFAYRIDAGWAVFALTAASALLIAGLTVSWQSIRAAAADPVRALRHD